MNKVYELNVYDKGYVREFRWFFSKPMTPNQMLNIAMKNLDDRNITPMKDNFDSDVEVEMFSARLSTLIYVDFDEVVLDDSLLDCLESKVSQNQQIPPPPPPPPTREIKGDKLIPLKPTYPTQPQIKK